jgi:Domain of unknown function (DUF892)
MGLFTRDIKTINDLFVHTLRDIYYAEQQIVKSLPEMIEKAHDAQLKQALQSHLGESKNHVKRVEEVFRLHGADAKGIDCPAIDGIIEEAEDVVGEVADDQVLDGHHHRRRAGGRALRDHALRFADRVGEASRPQRLRQPARAEPPGGKGGRQEAHRHCREQGQPARGVTVWLRRSSNKQQRHPEEVARACARPSRRMDTSTEPCGHPSRRAPPGALLRMTAVWVARATIICV